MTGEELYPPISPYRTHYLAVETSHVLYVEEAGNPDGIPVIFLHGGPGAGSKPVQRRTFDPQRYRIIFFDQRGCGRSTPSAELAGNTTDALIADIEQIRKHLGLDTWMVAGGSWGSLLALGYGIAHPGRCLALRVHGIFLGRPEEIRFWFHGIGALFPDAFEEFAGHVPPDERDDLLAAYHRRLVDPDPVVHHQAAQALRGFSARTQTFLPSPSHVHALTEPKAALEIARIFTHYCANGCFLPENHVLANIDRIRHLPCEIVQGRYDVVTPMQTAWALHRAWPEARFTTVVMANHVSTLAAGDLSSALRAASDRLADGIAHLPIETYLAPRAHHTPVLSDDSARLAWLSNETGFDQIWIRDMTADESEPALRLHLDEPVGTLAFRPDSHDLLFTTDRGGDERHQLHLIRAGESSAQPLTHQTGRVHQWGAFDSAGERIAYASNAADPEAMQIHVRDLASGEDRVVRQGPGWRTARNFTPDGKTLLVEDNSAGMFDASLACIDIATGEERVLLPGGTKTHVNVARWVDDAARLLLATDHQARFHGVAEIKSESGAFAWVAQPPGDVEQLAVSKDQTRIAYAWNDGGRSRIVLRDRMAGDERTLETPFPGRLTSLTFTPGGDALIFAIAGFRRPSAIVRLKPAGGACEILCEGTPLIAPEDTVEPETVTVRSFDGAEVPAFVFAPRHPAPASGRPAMVIVHGGPESQYAAHWRADVQYLVRRGWVVVAPNVRGSTGYGRDWQAADDLEKRMDSVRDLKAVRDWLAAREDVDENRLVVSGQSYGGFMVLATITEHPDDWCAAVDFYGIADFNTLMATTGPWRRTLRAVEYGNPDTEEGRELLRSLSPMRKIGSVRTPLFIAHGGDDPRVTPAESELVYAALRGRDRDCALVRIDHEGHGFVRAENRERVYGAMMRFLENRTRPSSAIPRRSDETSAIL